GIRDPQGRSSQEMPSARRLEGIDSRLATGDGDRSGRDLEPGFIMTCQSAQGRREVTRIREPRQETNREDVIGRRRVKSHEFITRKIQSSGGRFEIKTVVKDRYHQQSPLTWLS